MQLMAAQGYLEEGSTPASACLSRAISLAREGLLESHNAIQGLTPGGHCKQTFGPRLKRRIELMTAGTLVKSRTLFLGDRFALPPAAEEALFQASMEAVTNALRHANARNITVTVACLKHCVSITILDDGNGFSPPAVASTRGLRGLRDHVEDHGGLVEISSMIGQGTRIEILFPLEAGA
jgi:signal transduction histidine kinase